MQSYSVFCLECEYRDVGVVDTKDLAAEMAAQIACDHVDTAEHTVHATVGEYHIPKEDEYNDREFAWWVGL